MAKVGQVSRQKGSEATEAHVASHTLNLCHVPHRNVAKILAAHVNAVRQPLTEGSSLSQIPTSAKYSQASGRTSEHPAQRILKKTLCLAESYMSMVCSALMSSLVYSCQEKQPCTDNGSAQSLSRAWADTQAYHTQAHASTCRQIHKQRQRQHANDSKSMLQVALQLRAAWRQAHQVCHGHLIADSKMSSQRPKVAALQATRGCTRALVHVPIPRHS